MMKEMSSKKMDPTAKIERMMLQMIHLVTKSLQLGCMCKETDTPNIGTVNPIKAIVKLVVLTGYRMYSQMLTSYLK